MVAGEWGADDSGRFQETPSELFLAMPQRQDSFAIDLRQG